MSKPDPLLQSSATPPPTPSPKALLLPLFLLILFCCAPAGSASAGADKQRSWGAAESPAGSGSGLEVTSTYWSSASEFYRRVTIGSGDLMDSEITVVEEKVLPDALEDSDGTLFIVRAALPPPSEPLVPESEIRSPDDKYVIIKRSDYHGLSQDWPHPSLDKEGKLFSARTVWSQVEKSKGHDLFEQRNWGQEGEKFEQVSSEDKSSGEPRHGSSITTTVGKKREVAIVKERETHLRPRKWEQPRKNKGGGREQEVQKPGPGETLPLGTDRHITSDHSKRNFGRASTTLSGDSHDNVLRDRPNTVRVTRGLGTQHSSTEISGLYTSDSKRDEHTSVDILGLHNIPSATPVATQPGETSPASSLRDTARLAMGVPIGGKPENQADGWHTGVGGDDHAGGWHTGIRGDNHAGGQHTGIGGDDLAGGWHKGIGGDDHTGGWHTGVGGEDHAGGWHTVGDLQPAWETFQEDDRSLDYHHQHDDMIESTVDQGDQTWPSGGDDHDHWPSGGAEHSSWPSGGTDHDQWPPGSTDYDNWPTGGARYDHWPSGGADHDNWPPGAIHGGPRIPHLGPGPPGLTTESGCGCWDTDAVTPEVECSCWGSPLTQVPSDFSKGVFRITLNNVKLTTVRNDSFISYRRSLHEIVLENMGELHTIEVGSFKGLHQLRSIYIHLAPQLKTMPNLTFAEDNKNLKSLRITNSGLEMIPNMKFIGHAEIIKMIELDSNRIKKVHTNSLEVRVDQLSLNYNLIESVEREAFAGSKIGKLSLKGNIHLENLHPHAFENIGSLLSLDLSGTSITSLPTLGLNGLEFLYLVNTPSLKVFPSVYSFKTIKQANLTYPYHCCAFQFPEQHDPEQYIKYQNFKRKMEQKFCSEVTSPSSHVMISATRPRRRRRHVTPPMGIPQDLGGSRRIGALTPPTDEPQGARGGPIPVEVIPGVRSGYGNKGERWGGVPSGVTGTVFDLSVPSNTMKYSDENRNEQYRSSERSQTFLADPSPRETDLDLQQYWKTIWLGTAPNPHILGGSAHLRTRHNGHHSRYIKAKIGSNSDQEDVRTALTGYNFEGLKSRPRRGDHSQLRRLPGGGDDVHQLPLPTPQQQRTAALIRDPVKELIPLPDKRFDEGDGSYPHQDESYFGGGALGDVHGPFLGFGSFNHTPGRYVPEPPRSSNSSSRGWEHDQGLIDRNTALDLGDDSIYKTSSEAHDGSRVLDYPGKKKVFHYPDGDFPDAHEEGPQGEIMSELGGHDLSSNDGWHHNGTKVKNTTMIVSCGELSKDYHSVLCVPEPDAFNPCEDIMGNLALRVAVWLVVITAVLGNLAVIIVLISSKFKMTVSKFLMVNLALADLCMGVYLLIIAAMDLHTIGVYFNHAIDWQNGPGCKVAGFLTVFASELSIFTLTVITSERWYAITYAIHLNKRLKLSMAVKIMVVGWTYSISMAALPLLGISSYSKTSICLPMETGNGLALAYLVSLLLVNGLAFVVITACYTSMYCSISRHDATAPHSDLTVAKRMALLVFTDFACWAPIAFFGLTAVAGVPLINVTRAKILLVFFYPLNSCANPYLYAILTKQYRRDLFILLARYGFCTKRAMRYKGAYSSVNNTFPHNTVVNAPNHRNSTLTQITLCDLTRTARASQQSNNGSLLGTMVGGSQDSLQRNVSPLRTPTKPDSCTAENERLSTVQEMSHSTHSDDEPSPDEHHNLPHNDHRHLHDSSSSPSGVVKQAGSPHPIKNCYTRLSFTPEQEEILKQAVNESKAKKKAKAEGETSTKATSPVKQGLLTDQGLPTTENGKSPGHGEAIVICEVEINHVGDNKTHRALEEVEEATSTV